MKTLKEQAQRIKEIGSPLTIEQITAFLEKKEADKAKRDKRSAKAWKRRDESNKASKQLDAELEKMTPREKSEYFENVQRRSIQGQLPSSMR